MQKIIESSFFFSSHGFLPLRCFIFMTEKVEQTVDNIEDAFAKRILAEFFGGLDSYLGTDKNFAENDAGFCCGRINGKCDAIGRRGIGKVFGVECADAIFIDKMQDDLLTLDLLPGEEGFYQALDSFVIKF